ncbi:putative ribonuclease E [Rhodotorula toruloides]|nr:putative ribonuclease E [Rhodotorula toruloides]
MSSQAAETLNPYACRWRYCTEAFSSSAELRDHVMRHVDESEPQRPQPVPAQGAEHLTANKASHNCGKGQSSNRRTGSSEAVSRRMYS